MNQFLNKLLTYFHLDITDYQNLTRDLTYDDLEDPYDFLDMEKVSKRILQAIANNEKIMIYGDYDCDGFSSVSVMVRMFSLLKYGKIGYYVPSRFTDGYGINVAKMEMIIQKGYSLLILVDNGVAQNEALDLAKKHHIDVIIIDHHEIMRELPPHYGLIHPFFKKSNLNLPECATYCAFCLSRVILGYVDEYLLVLAMMATLSDMMPLTSFNRDIVRIGLNIIKKEQYLQFLLLNDHKEITSERDFSFVIIPKINSVGRIIRDSKSNRVINYLTSKKKEEICSLGEFIIKCNDERKRMLQETTSSLDVSLFQNDDVIVLFLENFSEGLVGLIANQLAKKYFKPCVVFTYGEDKNLLKGSARSFNGFPLSEVFASLREENLLEVFGGHAKAGGVTIKKENYRLFKEKINLLAKGKTLSDDEKIIIPCTKEELTYENYLLIQSLAPYGEGNKEPYLEITYPSSNIIYLSFGKHLKGMINDKCSFIAFNVNHTYPSNLNLTLRGKLEEDTFRGNHNLSFKVDEVIE
jgi:single-stranded-DNA-specific exonuclease